MGWESGRSIREAGVKQVSKMLTGRFKSILKVYLGLGKHKQTQLEMMFMSILSCYPVLDMLSRFIFSKERGLWELESHFLQYK